MKLGIDDKLVGALVAATNDAFSMAGISPLPVGASRIATPRHEFSVIVGMVGRNSGSMTLNLSKSAMFFVAQRLTEQPQNEITEENIDAAMELGNMLAGGVKEQLLGSAYEIAQISLPSMIASHRYDVMFARGILTVSVEFELTEMPMTAFADRYFSLSLSLLKGAGQSFDTPRDAAA